MLSSNIGACDAPVTQRQPSPALAVGNFPPGFTWGVATSAYQIEGAAREDGRGESIWDRFSHTPGNTVAGATGDVACDHYHRWEHDLDLMHSLGVQSYRFSIAWSRIFPGGSGAVNQSGLDFYNKLVDGLVQRGMHPLATLYHWDLPQALQDHGGWENRDTSQRFADFADAMFGALGDRVAGWLTLNEPKTVVDVGYIYGTHAPGFRDPQRAYVAQHHLLLGHGLAVRAYRAHHLTAPIGIALNLSPVYAAPDTPNAAPAVRLRDGYENRHYLDPIFHGTYPQDVMDDLRGKGINLDHIQSGDLTVIAQPIDQLGVNYYNPAVVNARGDDVHVYPTTIATWEQVYPTGLYDILVRLHQDYGAIPLVITENGMPSSAIPDASQQIPDADRITYLRDHCTAMLKAIRAGVRVTGYHLWSLLDNFEWAEGYSQRWGIVYVDYATQQRIPKHSALWYRDMIRRNGVE